MFKTRLDTFGNDFGHFSIFENFLIFLKFFEDSPSMEHWAKIFFGKITPKHVQNTFGHFGNDFGHFSIFESFLIFLKIFEDSTLQLGKKIFRKNYPKTCSKHVWTPLGTIMGIFRFLKIF